MRGRVCGVMSGMVSGWVRVGSRQSRNNTHYNLRLDKLGGTPLVFCSARFVVSNSVCPAFVVIRANHAPHVSQSSRRGVCASENCLYYSHACLQGKDDHAQRRETHIQQHP